MDVSLRKQGMKGGNVLVHVTDLNDAADEESAPFCRAKKALYPIPLFYNTPLCEWSSTLRISCQSFVYVLDLRHGVNKIVRRHKSVCEWNECRIQTVLKTKVDVRP
jgi:hypothetical protein